MKLSRDARDKLAAIIADRVAQGNESYAEIGLRVGVHPSQVSRICRGEFKTASYNVMQICVALGVPFEGLTSEPVSPDQRRLEVAVTAVWDKSSEDANRIVRMLRQLHDFRGGA